MHGAEVTSRTAQLRSPANLVRFDSWLLAPAPRERLAGLRILVGGFVLVYVLANVGEFDRLARQPPAPFEPVGIAQILNTPMSGTAVWMLFALLLVTGGAFVGGIYFRVSGPTFALLTLVWASYHSSWGQMLHFEHLFTLHLLVLAFSPAAAAWSADARREEGGESAPTVRFGWPIRLMAIISVLTYVIAGVAKLRQSGLSWIDGSTLQNHIAYSATRVDLLGGIEPPLASAVVGLPWLVAPMAALALAIELLAPISLLGGRFRNLWVVSAIAFHTATAATMMVWFPYQGLGFALLPLFHVERLSGAGTIRSQW